LIVGHQPQLGDWIGRLVNGAPQSEIYLSKSGVARLDMMTSDGQPRAELRWLMPAKLIKRIGIR
jgi:phosphohistidine phosphatase SixA